MVTVLFFTLLLPTFDPAWVNLSTHLTHIVPLVVTTIDFFFNKIDFEWKHAINVIVFNLCYLTVMISYTLTVTPVYSIFPLKDAANFGLLSSILVAFLAVYCILALLIWFKFWIVGDLKDTQAEEEPTREVELKEGGENEEDETTAFIKTNQTQVIIL